MASDGESGLILVMYSNFSPSPRHLAALAGLSGGMKVHVARDEADAIARAGQAQIVIGHRYLRQILPDALQLRWVQSSAGGIDLLKAPELIGRNITLCRCSANTASVAHHALALGWALTRDLPSAIQAQSRGEYFAPCPRLPLPQTALVIGLGAIGQHLAAQLRALGLQVKGMARRGTEEQRQACDRYFPADQLHGALPGSDLCFLTLPLNAASRGLIGAAELELLPPHAVLVSVTRSAVFDLDALILALCARRLGGAALDGLDPVPSPDSAIWTTPHLLITPKLAAHHAQMQHCTEGFVEAQLARYLSDPASLHDIVDPQTLRDSFSLPG